MSSKRKHDTKSTSPRNSKRLHGPTPASSSSSSSIASDLMGAPTSSSSTKRSQDAQPGRGNAKRVRGSTETSPSPLGDVSGLGPTAASGSIHEASHSAIHGPLTPETVSCIGCLLFLIVDIERCCWQCWWQITSLDTDALCRWISQQNVLKNRHVKLLVANELDGTLLPGLSQKELVDMYRLPAGAAKKLMRLLVAKGLVADGMNLTISIAWASDFPFLTCVAVRAGDHIDEKQSEPPGYHGTQGAANSSAPQQRISQVRVRACVHVCVFACEYSNSALLSSSLRAAPYLPPHRQRSGLSKR